MPTPRPTLAALLLTPVLGVLVAGAASTPAMAADIVAADPGTTGTIITSSPQAPTRTAAPRAVADLPRGIVVTNHDGQPVSLFAEGRAPLRKPRPGSGPATFTGLSAGTTYTVVVGGKAIGRVTALAKPAPATDLVVRTADTPDSVVLSWHHRPSISTGGRQVAYDMLASSSTAPAIRASVRGVTTGRLTGLDPAALYTFSVTPRNTAAVGQPTVARMTKSLGQIVGTTPAPTPTPTPEPTAVPVPVPTSNPAPAASDTSAGTAPAAATITIYVCPGGFADNGGLCQKTAAYTYDVKPYTTHAEPVYGYGQVGWDYTAGYCTGGGTSGNWSNGDPYCRNAVYGDGAVIGTQTVRDATPAGYTDTGSEWRKRDPAPAGYLDDGTQWVLTVPKEARVVPA